MATWAIGDIHGRLDALDDLLRQVEPGLGAADTVVFLGDYVDRGPASRGCIERILALRAATPARVVTLLGNHEQWMLRSRRDPTRHSWLLGMEAMPTIASYSQAAAAAIAAAAERLGVRLVTGRVALPYDLFFAALPPAHLAFFEGLAPYHRTAEAVFTHGGCDPAGGPVETQPVDALVWGGDGFPEEYAGPDLLVFGHRNEAGLDRAGRPRPWLGAHSIGIDTSAHGVVTAIRLPDRAICQSGRGMA